MFYQPTLNEVLAPGLYLSCLAKQKGVYCYSLFRIIVFEAGHIDTHNKYVTD